MDARLQRRIQRYGWDKAAGCYEQYWARQLQPAQDRTLARAELAPGERVLDVACGTGLVTFRAADAVGPTGRVVGTDISDAMIEAIRQRAAERGLAHISAERCDAEDIAVEDEAFDVVLCALGLMYVADPPRALAQMHRALRPGGRIAISVWGPRTRCGWAEIFPIVERRVASEVCPLFFQLGNGDAVPYALGEAEFVDVTMDRISTTLAYDSAETACGAAFAGGPVALAYSRFDAPTRQAVHAEYLASIEPYRRGAGYDVPGEFVIAHATKSRGAPQPPASSRATAAVGE
jgi:ubiquinone/menaquinone biosynthesis C-methylase UbiE